MMLRRLVNAGTWLTVYTVFAATGVAVGHQLALEHNLNLGAVVLSANTSNANANNSNGGGNGHEPFSVTSAAVTGLKPGGTAKPLSLILSNNDNSAYQLLTFQIDVTSPNGCNGPANLVISGMGKAQLIGTSNAYSSGSTGAPQFVIPKKGSLAVPGVTIRMANLATNQDACKNQTFVLSYSGTATQGN